MLWRAAQKTKDQKHNKHYDKEEKKYVNPFIVKHVSRLKEMRDAFKQNNPEDIFDLFTKSEYLQGFYMLCNLIRRNDETLFDDMRFLLSIPNLKVLASIGVNPEEENELIRMAQRLVVGLTCVP